MTITASTEVLGSAGREPGGLSSILHDIVVLTRRNLVHVRREPAQLSDVTAQPILFTMLFIFVFGSGIPVSGGSYKDFALGGLLLLNLTTSAMGTGVGIAADMSTGAIDRFRSLPIWRPAVLVGRTLSDLLAAALCVTIVAMTGLLVGWRPDSSAASVVGAFGIALLFSYSLSWLCACIGLISKGPESAQGVGLLVLFPVAFVSNALVPTRGMPGWLQTVADWNPVSAVTAACRDLFGNPNPSGEISAWPMQHPVVASFGWALVILAVFAPTAVFLFRRRTSE